MDQPKIEKGIPLPKRKIPGKWLDIIEDMEVRDSFLIPIIDRKQIEQIAKSFRASMLLAFKSGRIDMKFVTRTVEGGLRVWRIE